MQFGLLLRGLRLRLGFRLLHLCLLGRLLLLYQLGNGGRELLAVAQFGHANILQRCQ